MVGGLVFEVFVFLGLRCVGINLERVASKKIFTKYIIKNILYKLPVLQVGSGRSFVSGFPPQKLDTDLDKAS